MGFFVNLSSVMNYRLKSILGVLLVYVMPVIAQKDSLKKWTFGGYADVYYSYDFSEPVNNTKPDFIYNHKRHNEVTSNLILARTAYTSSKIKANVSLMTGGYAQYNLSTEPLWAQFIYESTLGVRLSDKHNLWIEAGIFPSHIGFESAIGADCWNLTRSLVAENSPYYESGLKCTYTNPSGKWSLVVLALNGWQRITRLPAMQLPAGGFQLSYRPSSQMLFNYSSFLGSVRPDSVNAIRQYHNVYWQFETDARFGCIAGFDLGHDKYNTTNYDIWYAPVLIARMGFGPRFYIALRGEYYDDAKQIQIVTNTSGGFRVWGTSVNLDYKLTDEALFRLEFKNYSATEPLFRNKRENYYISTSLSLKL